MREVEKQRLNAVSLEEAQDKYTEIAGELAADTLRVAHENQNRGQGVTKAQYVEATMAFMEKENAFQWSKCMTNGCTKPQTFTSKTGRNKCVVSNKRVRQQEQLANI